MAGRLIPLRELTPRDEGAWRDLAGRTAEPNPFFEPDAVLAAHRHLGFARGVALLVVEEAAGWSACLPVHRVRLGGVAGALRSWSHPYVFLGVPLLDREQPGAAFGVLVAAAVGERGVRFAALDLLRADGSAGLLDDVLASRDLTLVLESVHERAALDRRQDGGYLDLGRHHERELQRLWRRLEETAAAPLELRDRSEDPGAVETFLSVEASGWKGREGTALASTAGHADFFRELCGHFRSSGRLQLLSLEAGERTVAMKCNFSAGEGMFCFKIGHDDALRQFSPGVQLERLNVEVFHDSRPERWMDSCAVPDNEMINRLWPDRRRLRSVIIGPRNLSAALSKPAMRALRSLRARR